MTHAVHPSPEPISVTALPLLYSPSTEYAAPGPERKRTYIAFMYPSVEAEAAGAGVYTGAAEAPLSVMLRYDAEMKPS